MALTFNLNQNSSRKHPKKQHARENASVFGNTKKRIQFGVYAYKTDEDLKMTSAMFWQEMRIFLWTWRGVA